jgi:hypothetical protein
MQVQKRVKRAKIALEGQRLTDGALAPSASQYNCTQDWDSKAGVRSSQSFDFCLKTTLSSMLLKITHAQAKYEYCEACDRRVNAFSGYRCTDSTAPQQAAIWSELHV